VKFSLAMPTRNMGSHIGAAVKSALDQPGVEVELLVQDACSTDDTAEVL
jgi:glycosyltransferase involved in cell wall biosynthesis